jgi:hypothetical protein
LIGHFGIPTQMRRLDFALVTPHPDEEEQFLRELMTPGSPQFHKFLTADQWIARFAPSAADEQAVVDWATSQGLTVTHRFPNRLIVGVEAPMATIEKALQVRINNYLLDGYTYFANEREPVLPARLAGVVRHVEGLHNFPLMTPTSFHGPIPPGAIYNPGTAAGQRLTGHADGDRAKYEKARAASRANVVPIPNITKGAYDPTDIYAPNAYDYDALQAQGHCCNPNHAPGGAPPQASIAIAAYGNLQYTGSFPHATFTDLVGYQAQYSYLAYNVTAITVDGGPTFCTVTKTNSCGADLETTLDTEWSLTTANSMGSYLDTAQVFVYEGENGYPGKVFNQILSDGNAKVLTTSFSCGGEDQCGGSLISSMHSIFNSMAGQGWTLMSASGDQGATADCSKTTGTTSVSYPASDPDFVGVGGTTLQSGGLGGAFGSEVAWTGGTGAGSCAPPTNAGGSTGGCSAVFGVPGYQSGSNGTCGTQRGVPDISLNANVSQNMYYNGGLFGVGGTSIASPMVAGFFAQEGAYLVYLDSVTGNNCGSEHLDCEQIDGGMGIGNYYLYSFGTNPSSPSSPPHYPFYDITSGCNSNDITALLSLTFYCAGPGYDLVTGWGTANMLQLAWAINTFLAGDFSPPAVNFSGVVAGKWYNVPPTVAWSISDTSENGAVPNGVAGFSQAWDADPGDVYLGSRASYNNSYFSGPEFPNATTGLLTLTTEGCHTANVRSWDNGGTSSDNTFKACFDNIPPVVTCGPPDGLWHATDVAIPCIGSDGLSGLLHPADASFNLVTSVPSGTETAIAYTNSHTVFDVAGNFTTVGPIGPNMVDKKPPAITIIQPSATGLYLKNGTLTLNYSVTDGGSGVNTVTPTMDGNLTVGGKILTNGQSINLADLPAGSHTFKIIAIDNVGNQSSLSVTFNITALFVTGLPSSPPALRNNFSGFLGMELTVGSNPLSVSLVGRICVAGNSGMHTVKFVSISDGGTDVPGGSAVVNMAGCTAGQFVYAALSSPITLPAGNSYYLVSQEQNGGDQFYDLGGVSTTTDAAVTHSVYFNGTNWITPGGANTSYVPPGFGFTTAAASPPAFVVNFDLSGAPLRNNFSGFVGMKLTVGASPITVSSIGRVCVAGNALSHTVKFVNAGTGVDVTGGSVSVAMSGCQAGQFVYTTLSPQITLPAGGVYYLASSESSGGDQWYDSGTLNSNSGASVNGSFYFNGTSWIAAGGANTSFGPPNFVYSVPPAPGCSPGCFVTGFALTGPSLRNNFSGFLGMELTVGSNPLSVSSVGRICVAGNSGMHTVKFVNISDGGTDVPGGSAVVNMAGCTAGQFVYAALSTPITLPAGNNYYLVSQEQNGGDQFYDQGGISATTDAAVTHAVYFSGSSWITPGGANTSYVPPTFAYTTAISAPLPSFVVTYDLSGASLRNNFSGFVGMKLTVGPGPVPASMLGRVCIAGNSQSHTVELVKAGTGSVIGSATVSMAGCTPGQFVFAPISPGPVILSANTAYYLASQEASGGDQWYDSGTLTTTAVGTVNNSVYSADGITWIASNGANTSYVPPNFR